MCSQAHSWDQMAVFIPASRNSSPILVLFTGWFYIYPTNLILLTIFLDFASKSTCKNDSPSSKASLSATENKHASQDTPLTLPPATQYEVDKKSAASLHRWVHVLVESRGLCSGREISSELSIATSLQTRGFSLREYLQLYILSFHNLHLPLT